MSLIRKMLSAGSVSGAAIMSESEYLNAGEMVNTNLPILDIAFSGEVDGGFTSGITIVSGESKTFKSMLSLYCLKAYLDKYEEAIGIIYDTEFGISMDAIRSIGIDPNRVVHIPVEHVEQLKFDFSKKLDAIEKGERVFFLVDSIGQISSKKEVDDAHDEKSVADMSRAKAIRSLFRLTTIRLMKKNLPCFMVNHVYQELALYPKTIIPGGCMVEGTKITMYDGSLKSIELVRVGDIVKTLNGENEVTDIWNPETLVNGNPECFEVEFEDGTKVIVSENHPFLTENGWLPARSLTENVNVVSLVNEFSPV